MESFKVNDVRMPYFMLDCMYINTGYLDELESLEEEKPGRFITSPYDRDAAYEENMFYPTFEGDL